MVKIAPEALVSKPGGAAGTGRLGVSLFGLGGLGTQVVDRLLNRYQGQPEAIGLHPTWVDAVRNDSYATFAGPFRPSFSAAENRFLLSDAGYVSVLEEMAAGATPAGAPPITAAE